MCMLHLSIYSISFDCFIIIPIGCFVENKNTFLLTLINLYKNLTMILNSSIFHLGVNNKICTKYDCVKLPCPYKEGVLIFRFKLFS